MLLIAIGQQFAIDGNRGASVDMGHRTVGLLEQDDVNCRVDAGTNDIKLHEHVTIIHVLDLGMAHLALASPSAQPV